MSPSAIDDRRAIIRCEFQKFQQALRLGRWQAISEALSLEGEPELSSAERDEIDLAAACGLLPFDDDDDDSGDVPAGRD